MNTVTEYMIDDTDNPNNEVLTPHIQENFTIEQTVVFAGTWLMAIVSRYSGVSISISRTPSRKALAYNATHEGRTVGSVFVVGDAAGYL